MQDRTVRLFRGFLTTTGFAIALVVPLVTFSIWRYGSIKSAMLVWQGRPISIDSAVKSLGSVSGGTQHYRVFNLKNHSTRPFHLVGSTTTCQCVVAKELPITINPHGMSQLEVLVKVPEATQAPQEFAQEVKLYTDVPTQPFLILRVTGEVLVHLAEAG